MNVAQLIALLETVKDRSLEVSVESDPTNGYFIALPVDPVTDIRNGYVYIQEGE